MRACVHACMRACVHVCVCLQIYVYTVCMYLNNWAVNGK